MERVAKIKQKIDEGLGKNEDMVRELNKVNHEIDTAEEMKQKGTSADLELKKLKNWNEKKQRELDQLEAKKNELKEEKQRIEEKANEYEQKLTVIEEEHAISLKKLIKEKESILHNVYARNYVLKGYQEMSQNIRENELRCLEKLDFLKEKLELKKERLKALGYMEKKRDIDMNLVEDQVESTRKLYKKKIDNFTEENRVLKGKVEKLKKLAIELRNSTISLSSKASKSESMLLTESGTVLYSDINSLIETLSIDLSEQSSEF
jgi:chromosome segregation ATPase